MRTVPAPSPLYKGSGGLSKAGDVFWVISWEEGAREGELKECEHDSFRQDVVLCGNVLVRWLGRTAVGYGGACL